MTPTTNSDVADSAPGRAVRGTRTADRFRRAVEAGAHEAIRELFAENVRVFGPVVPEPVHGVRAAGAVVWAALSRFDGIRYIGQFGGWSRPNADEAAVETHVLRFRAELDGNTIEGIDVLEIDGEGLISGLIVLFRPVDWVLGTGFAPRRRARRSGVGG